jgi:hypothetical protein
MPKFTGNRPPEFASLRFFSASAHVLNFFNPWFWLGEKCTESDPAELVVLFRLLLEKKYLAQYPDDESITLPPKVIYHSETDAISGNFEEAACHLRQYGRMRFNESGALILHGDSNTISFHPVYSEGNFKIISMDIGHAYRFLEDSAWRAILGRNGIHIRWIDIRSLLLLDGNNEVDSNTIELIVLGSSGRLSPELVRAEVEVLKADSSERASLLWSGEHFASLIRERTEHDGSLPIGELLLPIVQ